MSGERSTRWAMVAIGLAAWVTSIAFFATWGIVASAVVVAWATFGLLTKP
jgi:hypothetical protein